MHVSSACPLRVALLHWQPRPDTFALTVVCKATFTLLPGTSPLAIMQEPVCTTDLVWEDGRGSLRAASDLVPFKERAEVVVVGHAQAPQGTSVTSLVARVAVGEVNKAIEVHGDRWWTREGLLTAEVPFATMPLRWERAAGGPGTWNPVGLPVRSAAEAQELRPVPNLLPIGAALRHPEEAILPVGFGPLAPTWPERVAKLRQHATTFRHEAWAERPLPEDIDAACFNVAPPDQQMDHLRADERIALEHLHPYDPRLVTVLEEVIPRAVVHRSGEAPWEIRLRCDTLVINADRGTCTLTWRGRVPLRHPAEDGVVLVTAERTTRDEDATATLVPAAHVAAGTTGPILPSAVHRPALPFAPPAGEAQAVAESGARRITSAQPDRLESSERTTTPAPASEEADTLPGRLVPVEIGDATGTLTAPLVPAGAAPLPFRPAPGAPEATPRRPTPPPPPLLNALATPPREEGEIGDATGTLTAPLVPAGAASLPFRPAPGAPEATPRRPTPPPPPLLNALASPPREEGEDDEPRTARRPSKPAQPVSAPALTPESPAPALPTTPSPRPPPEPPGRVEDIPVERFAEISAELAEGRSPRPEVLRAHELDDRSWAAAELHWRNALEKEGARGGRWRAAYDGAYVTTVERFRGPITLPEYARIAVGLERGQANEALDALNIQRAALMPIVRIWTRKAAGDPKLSSQVMSQMASLRAE